MPRLVFIDEKFAGQSFALTKEIITVGRGEANDLVIPDPSVSLEHCRIITNGPEVIVAERGSSNGIFVNDIRIDQQMQVKSGQRIRIGNVVACLEIGPIDESSEGEEMTAIRTLKRIEKQTARTPEPVVAQGRLHTDTDMATEDTTVLMKPPPAREAVSPMAFASRPQGPTKNENRNRTWIWGVCVMVIALAAVLFILRKLGR